MMGPESLEDSSSPAPPPPAAKKYGVTKPISVAGPNESDFQRNTDLEKFLLDAGLYESEEDALRRVEVLRRIDQIVKRWVKQLTRQRGYTDQMVEDANAVMHTFGSYRLGVHGPGADMDTLCVGPSYVNREEDFFIVLHDMLAEMEDVTELQPVPDAHVPVMKFKLQGISVDLLYASISLLAVPEMQAKGGDSGDSAVTGHRTTVRIDGRVDANNNNNNHVGLQVYLNLRQRPSSPHHRVLRLTTQVEGDQTARMCLSQVLQLCVTLFILGGLPLNVALGVESRTLNVGEELWKEILPLQMGSRLYNLKGLKSNTWYEVKISYPASIPSRFSLQLKKGSSELGLNHKRKLLNTEKLIFKTDNLDSLLNQEEIFVLVIVEPEGVVVMARVYERKEVIFNIVCDELLLGIPHHACLVALFVLICLGLALILPTYLLREDGRSSQNQNATKDS